MSKNSEMAYKCNFCDSQVELKNGYYVCENCKKVAFVCGTPENEIRKQISEYLKEQERLISDLSNELHKIEQADLLGQELDADDIKIRDCLIQFQQIKVELQHICSTSGLLSTDRARNILYQLLCLAPELKNIIGG